MSSHRFFLEAPLVEGAPVQQPALSVSDVHHALNVLRLDVDAEIVVVAPDGATWRTRIVETHSDALHVRVLEEMPPAMACRVTVIQGVAKGSKVDLVVEKATELNVEAVIPVLTERSVVRLDSEKRRARGDRWRRVALAAAKQSGRSSVPVVSDPVTLAEVCTRLGEFDTILVVWEGAAASGPGIGQALDEAGARAASRIALVVGPEGGLTAEEVWELERAGARAVTLGTTVLRSETAGIVASALCVYELGGLGGRPRA